MNRTAALLLVLAFAGCAPTQFIQKGTHNGVEVAYRWNHPPGGPSELLLRLKNTAADDRNVNVVLDLHYQGRTMETLEADTCIKAGQTLNGKLNGIYFIPERLTTAQIKDGSADVEMTRTLIEPATCP